MIFSHQPLCPDFYSHDNISIFVADVILLMHFFIKLFTLKRINTLNCIDLPEIEGNHYKQRKSTNPRLRVDKYDVFNKRFYILHLISTHSAIQGTRIHRY